MMIEIFWTDLFLEEYVNIQNPEYVVNLHF